VPASYLNDSCFSAPQFSPHPCSSLLCHSQPVPIVFFLVITGPVPPASLSFPTGIYSFFLSFPRRRESRSLWQKGTQIAPLRIDILDQIHLPRPSPFSDPFLALDRIFIITVFLIVH